MSCWALRGQVLGVPQASSSLPFDETASRPKIEPTATPTAPTPKEA